MILTQQGNIAVLCWQQDVTIDTIESFKQAISELKSQKQKFLLLDLQGVKYLNSLSLGIISEAVVSVRRHDKEMVVAGMEDTVEEIFEIVKFHKFIRLFKRREQAIDYFKNEQTT